MSIRVSKRTQEVERAKTKIAVKVIHMVDEAGLTDIEYLSMLVSMQAGALKSMLRAERHPDDPDRPAMEE